MVAADATVITLARSPAPRGVTSNIGHPTEPVVVELTLSASTPVLLISEGSGHLGSGGAFWLDEIVSPGGLRAEWRPAFERADALWLVPVLVRLAGDLAEEKR